MLDLRIAGLQLLVFGDQCLVLAKDFRVLRTNQRFQCFAIQILEIGKVRALGHRERSISKTKFVANQLLIISLTPPSGVRSCALGGANRSLPATSKAVRATERLFHSLLAAR